GSNWPRWSMLSLWFIRSQQFFFLGRGSNPLSANAFSIPYSPPTSVEANFCRVSYEIRALVSFCIAAANADTGLKERAIYANFSKPLEPLPKKPIYQELALRPHTADQTLHDWL